ncbi:MAG TPA: choice-of-anchor L domain-containing protein, partial [Saprospiraceae bacterium]|nr:choice-of-anchor L domain-containing protein [Saprospiraceae bacterium]
VGRTPAQTTSFSLGLESVPSIQPLIYPNAVRFVAPAECVDLQINASDMGEFTTIPMYLSVKCETCPETNVWKNNLVNSTGAAVLEVEGGQSAEELITGTLIDGDCFEVENVTYFGESGQIGTFSNGSTNIGFSNGVIIATGDINIAPGPNFIDNADGGFDNETPDGDLSGLTNGQLHDKAVIEFDFTPTETPVSFQFVFASEEYCEFVFSNYNDVFGFFISGPGISGTKNIALVPNTTPPIPITINNLNHEVNDDYYVNNQSFFSGDLCGQFPSFDQSVNEVQYDGFTEPLLATATVIPCQTYHIKLKIADVGDGLYDSAVFLKAGSFDGGGDATVDFVVNGVPGAPEANEGCDNVSLLLNRVGSNQSQPVTVSFSIGGTANPGADFSPIDTSFTIPAGQDQLSVPINIISDLLPEGIETIVLTLDNSCSCDVTQKTLSILDYAPLSDTSITIGICNSGDGVTLVANPLGGTPPFTYLWSTAETTPYIFVNPTVTTSYAVTIVDVCSDTAVNYFLVEVQALAEINENVSFCPGGSYTIGDSVYTQSTMVV